MYPTIRRIRRPLITPEPNSAETPLPSNAGDTSNPLNPSTGNSASTDRCEIENRSEIGQFRSDAEPKQGGDAGIAETKPDIRGNSSNSCNPSLEPTVSIPLWSRQLDEPAADYQMFVAWLQLPHPRNSRNAASALKCPLSRIRRLASHHNWKSRAGAFDNHRANITSVALDKLLQDEAADWQERAQRFRLREWMLHEEMIKAAHAAVAEIKKHPSRISLNDIVKLFDTASLLGRRATGMSTEPGSASQPPSGYLDPEAALRKIYGTNEMK